MQIHLSPRNLKLTATVHQHAAGVIVQLEDLAEVIAVHIVLLHDDAAKPKDRFCAKIHLALAGPDVFGEAKAENIHAALDSVTDKLARQLRKRKTSKVEKPRRVVQRATEKAKRS